MCKMQYLPKKPFPTNIFTPAVTWSSVSVFILYIFLGGHLTFGLITEGKQLKVEMIHWSIGSLNGTPRCRGCHSGRPKQASVACLGLLTPGNGGTTHWEKTVNLTGKPINNQQPSFVQNSTFKKKIPRLCGRVGQSIKHVGRKPTQKGQNRRMVSAAHRNMTEAKGAMMRGVVWSKG